MAKRNPTSRTKGQSSRSPRTPKRPSQSVRRRSGPAAASNPASASVSRRSTYGEAVALYERGVEALQHHDYTGAVECLEAILRQFPEEKELVERARLYLNVCSRQTTPPQDVPQTIKERLYAATLAINGGKYEEALKHLRLVRDEDPDNDHALYMLAVAHAQREEHFEAVAHLQRAIALNPENRALARRDPDLDALREDETFRTVLDLPTGSALGDRRRRR